jgi:hypothetical protein
MLLLQLDMLAYTNKAASEPTVVIGAGIPAEWLDRRMSVQGLAMPESQMDWSWDGKQMHVKVRSNKKINVQLSAVFPADTPLHIEYLE